MPDVSTVAHQGDLRRQGSRHFDNRLAYNLAMASAVQVSVGEYLQTSYRPDREFIDGEVRERNVGKWEHARIQALLASWFGSQEAQWGVLTATEQRVRVSPTRIRIPDLVVVRAERQPDVLAEPPLLV